MEDYSKEHGRGIRKVARILRGANEDNSVNDDEKNKEEAVESDPEYNWPKYTSLCDGEILLPMDIQKQLKCRFVDRGIPFLRIVPFKEEEIVLDPRIVVYHDVIYEGEIELLQKLAKPKLKVAQVLNFDEDEGSLEKTTPDRVGQIAWIEDYENKLVNILNRRVEHMTGLTANSVEPLQIGYYEIGGHYLPHYDFIEKEYLDSVTYFQRRGIGNRIATVLFYLNDVPKGGGTAFPNLDLSVWPKKGSAVFWHNLKRNGEGDTLTLHGACPVISGTKWIATIWLHEVGQEFLRPCTLLENE
ncbi:prolyl 4-hydroxylase subunit alpha-1-like isoform X2 [Belonocnema kinseyi]|nr:prolyl 4-hydroxylase subunit alpha-1-like isoform X2 [Belonocnema kinseyi]